MITRDYYNEQSLSQSHLPSPLMTQPAAPSSTKANFYMPKQRL